MLSNEKDCSRWFPVFLKFQGVRPEVLEVAEFEYLRHLVRGWENGALILDEGQLRINPSVQFVELHHFQPKLHRESGLYCFFQVEDDLCEYRLNLKQALIIDLLQDERKYSLEQLALQAIGHRMGASQNLQAWKDTILEMLDLGILVSRARITLQPQEMSSRQDKTNIRNDSQGAKQ